MDRLEKDSLGELNVPKDAYYGVHTQRSIHNFSISSLRWQHELISSIAYLKLSCAKANTKLKLLSTKKSSAIQKACKEVISGKLNEFPLDIFQAGSGTSTNMNVNEVIANRANEFLGGKKGDRSLVHPNDDVNKGQSTNNVIPSAIRVTTTFMMVDLLHNLRRLKKDLYTKGKEFSTVIKSGRTHLQDAVPITLGQEFNAYSTALSKHITRLEECEKFLTVLGIGGNAVGTGINTPASFRKLIIEHLNLETKKKFSLTKDGIESTQFLTDILALSSIMKNCAVDINKIANDLRLLSSGPKTGLNELTLPAVEPGSSIMPGKINPSIPEAVNMACYKIMGNDSTLTLASTAGNLDLNTHMPLIAHTIVESMEILTNASSTFSEKCIRGIKANKKQCKDYMEHSMALATALNPYLGYDKVSALVKESLKKNIPIKQLVLDKKLLSKQKLEKILDPKTLTGPNLK